MAAQGTKKKKQYKRPADRDQLVKKRLMEIDVDPGRDAEFPSIDNAEGAGTERTAGLKGIPLGAARSNRRKE